MLHIEPGKMSDDFDPTQITSPSTGAKKISREQVACLICQLFLDQNYKKRKKLNFARVCGA